MYSSKKQRLSLAVGSCVMALAAGLPAHAQTAQRAAEGRTGIEEITVTARRTEESLQSVPVAVTAFTAESLREKQISTPEDLQLSSPGVMLSGSGGGKNNTVYQIRGQSKALSGTSSPAVISYFAEVPDPNYGSFVPQYDMDSVQVLKGPQGTLFGRNTTGGALLYSPAAPTYELDGELSARFGNYSNQQYQAMINIPIITDKVALRIAADIQDRDGYSKDLRSGRDLDDANSDGFRVSLLLDPTDRISNLTIYDYYKSSTNGTASVMTEVPTDETLMTLYGVQADALAQLAAQRDRGPRKVYTSRDQFDDLERHSLTNRTEIDFGAVQIINIFGYRDVDLKYLTNVDGLPALVTDGSGAYPAGVQLEYIKGSLYQSLEQTSNELQFRGQAFDDKLNWIVGGFWLKNEPNGPQSNWVGFGHIIDTPDPATSFNFVTEESKAVFAHVTYDLDSLLAGLKLELGARYTKDEIESCTGVGVAATPNGTKLSDCKRGNTDKVVGASVNSASSNETTWSAGLNWQVTPDLFTYIVTRKGYRAGGINAPTFSGRMVPYQAFAPESVTDAEIGMRADWAIGNVDFRTNVSAFIAKYKDVQAVLSGVQVSPNCDPSNPDNPPGVSPDGDCDINNDPAGGTLLANLGESEVKGVEFEVVVAPLDGLTFNIGGSYVDTKTTKFTLPTALAPYVGTTSIPFNYTPETSFIAGARYEMQLDNGLAEQVVFNANYYWTDDIPYVESMLPSYSLTNLRVDFNRVAHSALDVGLFVRNAFDKDYMTTGNVSGAFIGQTVGLFGPPRMYGVELRYAFGQ